MTPYYLSVLPVFLIVFALSAIPCKAYMNKTFQLELEKLQYYNVTPDEIKAWWNDILKKRQEAQPRVFPICIAKDPKLGWPDAVKRFGSQFDFLNRTRDYQEKHLWNSTKKWLLKKIELFSMTVHPKYRPAGEQMNQWVSIVINVDRRLRGLYVQSIGGPLGIPVGEFVDLRCTRGTTQSLELGPFINLVPCSFSPRISETNPNVFIMDLPSKQKLKTLRLVLNPFKWSEAQCQEIGYFQFILIATADFVDFEESLSPIYQFSKLVAETGIPTPHYGGDDGINCRNFPNTNPPLFKVINGIRIIPNKEYDDCIVKGIGRGTTDIDQGTCPPGYLTCTTMWKSTSEWKTLNENNYKTFVRQMDNFQDCCEIDRNIKAPPPTTTMPPENTNSEDSKKQMVNAVKQDKYLKKKAIRLEKIHQVTHGDLCILVWLILIPMADHISRFLKDLPDFESVGLGFWIIAHIGLHSASLILVWLSFGLVVGSGDDKLGNVGVRHFLLGFICTAIQHAQFVTGLKRNLKERESFYYVLSHSLSGYISHFFGFVDVALSNAGMERKWLTVGFFLVWLTCTVASYYVEKVQDRRIGMSFHRAQCPVLQRIVMEDRKNPPLMGVKLGILAFMVISQVSMFTVMMVFYEASATVDKKIQELHIIATHQEY